MQYHFNNADETNKGKKQGIIKGAEVRGWIKNGAMVLWFYGAEAFQEPVKIFV
jgi:hypothetical protein